MKRIFTLLTLSFLVYQAQAQVLFSQDFESGSIAPMTALDIDGKVLDPNVANLAPTFGALQLTADNWVAASTSWFTPIGMADDWLISPAITVTDSNTFLIWEAWSFGAPPYQDGYEVRVSTTGNSDVANFTELLFSINAESNDVQKRLVNLDTFIGQEIHFAFRNNSFDRYILFVDNISVRQLRDADVVVKSVNFEKYNALNSQVNVQVTVENNGATPLTSLVFDWTVNGVTYTDTVTGLNIGSVRTGDVTHSIPFNVSEVGEYGVSVNVYEPNGLVDETPEDNGGFRKLYGLEERPSKKVFVEEATGTWCIWCPRGAVFMDLIASQLGDVVMPVAVHNGDPMAFAEYDGPFSASVSGYPSGHVDRRIKDIDPQNFPGAIGAVQNRIVPVAMDLTTEYDAASRVVTVRAAARVTVATQNNDFRFGAVITEDGVTGTGSGYAQANIYSGGGQGAMGGYENLPDPVPAAQMVYDFVARAIIGGFEGMEESVPDAVEANEEAFFEFTYTVPAGYDPEEMKVIVYVLDEETGEMLNGDIINLTDRATSVPSVPLAQSVLYPNPTTGEMTLEVDYQTTDPISMRIYNTTGQLIKSLGNLDLSAGNATEKINVSEMNSGNYILELRHKNTVTALPFTRI